jgi:hypothetical protein
MKTEFRHVTVSFTPDRPFPMAGRDQDETPITVIRTKTSAGFDDIKATVHGASISFSGFGKDMDSAARELARLLLLAADAGEFPPDAL